MFEEYCNYLDEDLPVDYWSDLGICAACALLSAFSEGEWSRLAQEWRTKSAVWKERCAQTIDAYCSPLVMAILLDMLEDEDDRVVVAAADSVRSMALAQVPISPAIVARLAALRDRSGIVDKIVLSALIKRTTPPLEGQLHESHRMHQSGVVNA